MSIFEKIFGQGQQQQQQPAPAAPSQQSSGAGQPGNIPPQAGATNPNNPQVPAGQPAPAANPGTDPANPSPLDNFASIWQPVEQDPNAPANQPLINVDPKTLAEAARKTDFSKMITPEQLAAIGQGGDAAVQAFAAAMNQVAQGVYAQSAFASTKIVEQAVNRAKEQFQNEIPAHVKRLQVSESLRNENPALKHPAAAPILGAIESQLTMKFPNASSTEITKMAQDYLSTFAGVVQAPAKAVEQAAQQNQNQDVDWDALMFGPKS